MCENKTYKYVFFFSFSDGDVNGDISGDEQSISSDHPADRQDEDSMDSDRGGALNLVRERLLNFSFNNGAGKHTRHLIGSAVPGACLRNCSLRLTKHLFCALARRAYTVRIVTNVYVFAHPRTV